METLNYKDKLYVDPGYIKNVTDSSGEPRFDALKHTKTLHEGDGGEFPVELPDGDVAYLGCDSGRIWEMTAEFGCVVTLDAGLSGYEVVRA